MLRTSRRRVTQLDIKEKKWGIRDAEVHAVLQLWVENAYDHWEESANAVYCQSDGGAL